MPRGHQELIAPGEPLVPLRRGLLSLKLLSKQKEQHRLEYTTRPCSRSAEGIVIAMVEKDLPLLNVDVEEGPILEVVPPRDPDLVEALLTLSKDLGRAISNILMDSR